MLFLSVGYKVLRLSAIILGFADLAIIDASSLPSSSPNALAPMGYLTFLTTSTVTENDRTLLQFVSRV